MKIFLSVQLYEDMINQPFEISDYLACRVTLSVKQNGVKKEICNSTFHDALILEIGKTLIDLAKCKGTTSNPIETFENAMEYTFKKSDNLLLIKEYSAYDKTTQTSFEGSFTEFFFAFFKEYNRYFKEILKQDPNAIQHDSVTIMGQQLECYKNIKNQF